MYLILKTNKHKAFRGRAKTSTNPKGYKKCSPEGAERRLNHGKNKEHNNDVGA